MPSDAARAQVAADRTGFRVPPGNPSNDIAESDTHELREPREPHELHELHPALARAPTPPDLAHLHIGHGRGDELLHALSKLWPNTLVPNRAGTDIATRAKDIEDGLTDIVDVGVTALANPALVERVHTGAPLNTHGGTPCLSTLQLN